MTEPNVSKPSVVVATTEQAVEYITNKLVDGELHMKAACKELGWSFPRIRSRALTIAKKMKCTFVKTSRGVYILEPFKSTTPAAENSSSITSVSLIEGDCSEDNKAEVALSGDNGSISNV